MDIEDEGEEGDAENFSDPEPGKCVRCGVETKFRWQYLCKDCDREYYAQMDFAESGEEDND